jgi:hypothetical protein
VPLVALATFPCLAGLPAAPVEQWRWDGRAEGYRCQATCLVSQLTDDNGHGLMDERDVPDVVVPQRGPFPDFTSRIHVLDGRDGSLEWVVTPPPAFVPEYLVIGDVDYDPTTRAPTRKGGPSSMSSSRQRATSRSPTTSCASCSPR